MPINIDLAMMALEGLTKNPVSIESNEGEIVIESSSKGIRELARLLLLVGGDDTDEGEEITLEPGLHSRAGSPRLRVKRTESPAVN